MTRFQTRSMLWQGARDAVPFLFVLVPFAMLFGVVATEAGLNLAEVMGLAVLVIAGAAQFAAVQQMVDAAPVAMVLATALAVNLRMAMYSASLTPWLGQAPLWKRALASYLLVDQSYLLTLTRCEADPDLSVAQRYAYFFGTMLLTAPGWYLATFVGARVGQAIPEAMALDFAMPITFLAMLAPMLKTLPHVAAALTSVALALALSGLPHGAGLMVAAGAAMGVGAGTESWLARRGGAA
ncbi:MAG: AzlC family ABC transporter permease [Maritimibacter sp.]|nr:AzlC family ABC transporter permease [Maritimibacter sp.]